MKKYVVVIFLMLTGTISPRVFADVPPALFVPPGLSLAEIKITGSEFVMLQNNTGATISDLGNYWLYDFNNTDPTTPGTSSSSQQLPAASLAAGQTILLSADGGVTCGAAVTAKLSISLTDTSGFLQVVHTNFSGGVLTQTAGDSVSWNSSSSVTIYNATAATITVPTTTAAKAAYVSYRYQNSSSPSVFWWQPASQSSTNICQLNVTIAGVSTPGPNNPGTALLPGTPPPATIINVGDGSQTPDSSALPPADVGLAAPIINEIMPNPAEPQTDGEDEFIELYSSNDVAFDLSGFKLQTGTTSLHTYTFPAGSSLAPKSFTAFYSVDTGLSLSNTNGQARLLDPAGNSISQSDVYNSAPDGQTWALANGAWYWTTIPTANLANIISQPLSVKSLSVGTTVAAKSATKKATSTTATKTAATPKIKAASTTTSNGSSTPAAKNASPLHPLVLAGVGAGAVAYAAYEYRNDLRNRFYQLRRYAAARAAAGKTTKKS
ncbi:MAG: lamin tail domain-containing protein [bacterium]|nr:lamin tail domain-containing protein [bacterium]